MTHLYQTLFPDSDNSQDYDPTEDIIINQLHGHLDFNVIPKYHDVPSYNNLHSHSPVK